VTFIVGYCGSGKSHLADQMQADLGIRKFDEGFLDDANQHAELIQALRAAVDCVVVEIHYCLEECRRDIVRELEPAVPGLTIEWVYFEVDIEKANQNCRRRTKNDPMGREHMAINRRIGLRYKIPAGVTPRPIFQLPES
jgi:hypothetical protein